MNRSSERALKDHYEDGRPGFGQYLDCITRSYGTGLGAFTIAFAAAHVLQQIAARRFPSLDRARLAASTVAGSLASYAAAKDRVRECRDSWAAWQQRRQ